MFQLPLVAYSNLQLSSEHEGDKRLYLLFLNISLYWKFGDYLYFLVSKAGKIEKSFGDSIIQSKIVLI